MLLFSSITSFSLTQSVEMTFEKGIFVVESGCEVKKVMANGEYCKPVSMTIKDGDKMERHTEMVKQVMEEMRSKSKGSSNSAKKQPAKKQPAKEQPAKKQPAKKHPLSDDSDDETRTKKSRTTTAKNRAPIKAAATGKRKQNEGKLRTCGGCGKLEAKRGSFSKCSGCYEELYCSKEVRTCPLYCYCPYHLHYFNHTTSNNHLIHYILMLQSLVVSS